MKTAMNLSSLFNHYSRRALILWFAFSLIAGILLVLALPVTLPGGSVEQVQRMILHLRIRELVSGGAYSFLVVLFAGFFLGIILFVFSALLAYWQPHPDHKTPSRYEWLFYAIPMITVWGIYLLAFWPAMMSSDSISNWGEAQSWHFSDGHPLLYLLLIWLVTRVWNSPAMFMIFQILCFSLLVAWGLGELRKRGLPAWAAWVTVLLFAISPVNGALSITMWKDVPYSLSVFALSLLIFVISMDPQRWLGKRFSWLILGIVAIFVGLLRFNGIIIAPLVFVLLALIYRSYWKTFARALALFIFAVWFVNVPLSSLLNVRKVSLIYGSLALHHIGAHITSGSEIPEKDNELIEQVMPRKDWHYNCYLVNTIMFSPSINTQYVMDHQADLFRASLRLFLKNPTVDMNHTACASTLVYRVFLSAEDYESVITGHALMPDGNGSMGYLYPNKYGLKEASVLPGLKFWLISVLDSSLLKKQHWLVWRPALYLYIFLFIGIVWMLRTRSWKAGLYMVPGIVHSVTLFLVNIAQDFRYQYAIYLLGLFSLAVLFMPVKRKGSNSEKESNF
jgi:MFS family permease